MIETAVVENIAAQAVSMGLDETTVQTLRERWPGVHLSYCMDDDISGVEPVHTAPGLNIYLVDGREHCLCLTGNPEVATGLVLAEVEDDDS